MIQAIYNHARINYSLSGLLSLDFVSTYLNNSKKELSEMSLILCIRLRRLSFDLSDNSIFSASSSRISSPFISEVYDFIKMSSKFSTESSFSGFDFIKFYCLISLIKLYNSINVSPLSYFIPADIFSY